MPEYVEELDDDSRLAMRQAAGYLQSEFKGVFNKETIELFLESSFDEFATRTCAKWIQVAFAERFAKQRLKALARVEAPSKDQPPAVLFLCVHNAGRSQMAIGWFSKLAGDRAIAWSGGSEPGVGVNPAAIAAMAEVGIDISQEFPKPWTEEFVQAADVVVTMGCGDACPIFPGKRYEDWVLEDPAGMSVAAIRPVRDEIGVRIEDLLQRLGVLTGA
ncbi:MAG: arsenate reductase ArsC [Acidimicrobiales bacterium]